MMAWQRFGDCDKGNLQRYRNLFHFVFNCCGNFNHRTIGTSGHTTGIHNQSHLASLDGLRGIAILIVIIAHIFNFNGAFGVDIFFVISGFLITTLLIREKTKNGTLSLSRFYSRRALRILPVIFAYLLVVAAVDVIFPVPDLTSNSFLSSLFFLRNTSVLPASDMATAHFWSLSVEEQFYIFFPLLLLAGERITRSILFALLAIVPTITYVFWHVAKASPLLLHAFEFTTHLPGIVIGALCSMFAMSSQSRVPSFGANKPNVSIILLAVAAIIHSNLISWLPSAVSQTISAALIALLIVINLTEGSKDYFFRFLNHRWLQKVGVLSYSLYVWQQFFVYQQFSTGDLVPAVRLVLNLILIGVVSYCSYKLVERPFLRWKARI